MCCSVVLLSPPLLPVQDAEGVRAAQNNAFVVLRKLNALLDAGRVVGLLPPTSGVSSSSNNNN